MRFIRKAEHQNDEIALFQQSIQPITSFFAEHLVHTGRRRGVATAVSQDPHPKGLRSQRQFLAGVSQADNAHRPAIKATQVVLSRDAPLMRALGIEEGRIAIGKCQREEQGMLGENRRRATGRSGDDQSLAKGLGNGRAVEARMIDVDPLQVRRSQNPEVRIFGQYSDIRFRDCGLEPIALGTGEALQLRTFHCRDEAIPVPAFVSERGDNLESGKLGHDQASGSERATTSKYLMSGKSAQRYPSASGEPKATSCSFTNARPVLPVSLTPRRRPDRTGGSS